MATTPFARPNWNFLALVPRLLVYIILCIWMFQYDQRIFLIYAFFLYLVISQASKFVHIPGSTFNSSKWIREGDFEKALPFLEKDVSYFTKNAWIDKYRYLLLIGNSRRTFREISLANKAYCLLWLGRVKEARELYEEILSEYPDNNNVEAQLAMINIVRESVIEEMRTGA